jgi:endoglucanase
LAELDDALDILSGIGFAVTIDLHPGPEFQSLHKSNSDVGLAQLTLVWRDLAQRLRNRSSESIYFELLNEPVVDAKIWRQQALSLIKEIRQISPDRTIIYGTAGASRFNDLAASLPLPAANIMYAVHYYDPFVFTHQGLTWEANSPLRYVASAPFPSKLDDPRIKELTKRLRKTGHRISAEEIEKTYQMPWNGRRIEEDISRLANWSARYKVPVVINEFGVLKFTARHRDRIAWLSAVRSAAEQNCIGWAHWEFADGFGFVNMERGDEVIDMTLIDSLLTPLR